MSAVKNNDELAFLKSYGYASNEEKIPAVNETRYAATFDIPFSYIVLHK